jgi:hypothetical protein
LIEGIFLPPYFEWFQFNNVSALHGTKLKSARLMPFWYQSYILATVWSPSMP